MAVAQVDNVNLQNRRKRTAWYKSISSGQTDEKGKALEVRIKVTWGVGVVGIEWNESEKKRTQSSFEEAVIVFHAVNSMLGLSFYRRGLERVRMHI